MQRINGVMTIPKHLGSLSGVAVMACVLIVVLVRVLLAPSEFRLDVPNRTHPAHDFFHRAVVREVVSLSRNGVFACEPSRLGLVTEIESPEELDSEFFSLALEIPGTFDNDDGPGDYQFRPDEKGVGAFQEASLAWSNVVPASRFREEWEAGGKSLALDESWVRFATPVILNNRQVVVYLILSSGYASKVVAVFRPAVTPSGWEIMSITNRRFFPERHNSGWAGYGKVYLRDEE